MKTMEPCNKLNAKMSFMKKEDEGAYCFRKRIVCKHVRSVWSDLCTEIQDWIIQKIQGWSLQRNTNLDNSAGGSLVVGKVAGWFFFSFPHYHLFFLTILSRKQYSNWPMGTIGTMSICRIKASFQVAIMILTGQILMNRRNELGGVRIDRMQYRRWGGQ